MSISFEISEIDVDTASQNTEYCLERRAETSFSLSTGYERCALVYFAGVAMNTWGKRWTRLNLPNQHSVNGVSDP